MRRIFANVTVHLWLDDSNTFTTIAELSSAILQSNKH